MSISASEIKSVEIGQSCLQGPCLHGIKLTFKDDRPPMVVQQVCGDKILRLIAASKCRVTPRHVVSHFNWFIENGQWNARTQKDHADKIDIKLMAELTVSYPKGFISKPICETENPKPKPKKPSKARQYLETRGFYMTSDMTMAQAKSLARSFGYT